MTLLSPGGADNRSDPVVHQKINGWLHRNLHHSPEYIAHAAMEGLLSGKKVVTPGLLPKLYVGLARVVPPALVDNVVKTIFK